MKKIIFIFLFILFILSCSIVPETNRKAFNVISVEEEIVMGEYAYREILSQSEVSKNKKYTDRMDAISKKLVNSVGDTMPNAKWEFNVIEQNEINAFALPGGKVAVYTALMDIATDDELAYVVGHEIAHVVARHGSERMSQQLAIAATGQIVGTIIGVKAPGYENIFYGAYGAGAAVGVLLPYSRKNEYEADEIGVLYAARAGYKPEASISLLNKFKSIIGESSNPQWLSTHPLDDSRINALQKLMPKMNEVYNSSK